MHSCFLQEQKRYDYVELTRLLNCSSEKTLIIIKKLKEYGILKVVKATDSQKNMTDLVDLDIEIANAENNNSNYFYVLTFVGIITVNGNILKCYPKYIKNKIEPLEELKQILKVILKFNTKEQIINLFNDSETASSFNILAVALFLLKDFFENGTYANTQSFIEINGNGEILWEKTVNETFAVLNKNTPFYMETKTLKQKENSQDYIKRLYECILTSLSNELKNADILELFDIPPVEISEEFVEDFGDMEYILYQIEIELNKEFNTRKQLILKTLYAYISNKTFIDDLNCFSMFGTNNFNLIWEKTCAAVMDNKLNAKLESLDLPIPLSKEYTPNTLLINLIDKPIWKNQEFEYMSNDTLIPDLISICKNNDEYQFIIFDAKYYTPSLNTNNVLSGQPGIESITKQYLYQLAYMPFINAHKFQSVKNCFLFPTDKENIIDKGIVYLPMLSELTLQDIQIRLIPAKLIFDYYLSNKKINICSLNL